MWSWRESFFFSPSSYFLQQKQHELSDSWEKNGDTTDSEPVNEHLMTRPPDCLYCFLSLSPSLLFFLPPVPAVPLWRSGAAGWQTSRGGDLITWSPWGVKTAAGRLRQTADNKRKVVCSRLQTTAISFIPSIGNVISCSLTWAGGLPEGNPCLIWRLHTRPLGG